MGREKAKSVFGHRQNLFICNEYGLLNLFKVASRAEK